MPAYHCCAVTKLCLVSILCKSSDQHYHVCPVYPVHQPRITYILFTYIISTAGRGCSTCVQLVFHTLQCISNIHRAYARSVQILNYALYVQLFKVFRLFSDNSMFIRSPVSAALVSVTLSRPGCTMTYEHLTIIGVCDRQSTHTPLTPACGLLSQRFSADIVPQTPRGCKSAIAKRKGV